MIGWVDWEEKETKGKQQGGGEHRASEGVHRQNKHSPVGTHTGHTPHTAREN